MSHRHEGFTVIELLIAIAIMGLVLPALYQFFLVASTEFVAQNGIIQMQSDARAAMDVIVRELRHSYGTPALSTTVTPNDTISFHRVEDTGRSTGGNTATTLNDTAKAWPEGAFAPSADGSYTLWIVTGTGASQRRTILSHTATRLTLASAWGITPDATSLYTITRNKGFTRPSATENILSYRLGSTAEPAPLADHITALEFAQPDPQTVTITLTARTQGIDPRTGQIRTYTLSETVRRRN